MNRDDLTHWHKHGRPADTSTPPIPLQDLTAADADDVGYAAHGARSHTRSSSRVLRSSPGRHEAQYTQLHPERDNALGLQVQNPGYPAESPVFSPVGPGFQSALGFAATPVATSSGFHSADSAAPPPLFRNRRATPRSHWSRDENDTAYDPRLPPEELHDGSGAFPSEHDADDVPLFETSRPAAPIESQSPRLSPRITPGQWNDRNRRSHSQNRFLSPSLIPSTFPGAESGSSIEAYQYNPHPNSSPRSHAELGHGHGPGPSALSTQDGHSALRRAGTIMRKMSQRVVNLSNDAQVVEHSIRRSGSYGNRDIPPTPVIPTAHLDGSAPSQHVHSLDSPSGQFKSPFAEKVSSLDPKLDPSRDPNPLRGNSLGIFPAENAVRRGLMAVLVHPWTEPLILLLILLQTALLTTESFIDTRSRRWGSVWIDYAMLGLFSFYSLELVVRVIVSGLIVNPVEYSSINRQMGLRKAVMLKANDLFAVQRRASFNRTETSTFSPTNPTLMRTLTANAIPSFDADGKQAQRWRLAHRAFLRHSFNRLDFVAVVSYWIGFALAITGWENARHIYAFRMLACLRIVKLLGITPGTSIILRSLKRAMPILFNVAFLIGFFWLLFGIIGVQSYKASLRRYCVWGSPDGTGIDSQYAQNTTGNFQYCGGWIALNGTAMPYLLSDGSWGAPSPKGYYCPMESVCRELENPYNGTVSFDNLVQSLELVFVIMTTNTFSDIMYDLTMSEYLPAALYFAAAIVIMTFWLVNLLIAVITSSFQIIREESKVSAFAAEEGDDNIDVDEDGESNPKEPTLHRLYRKSKVIWLAIIAFGLITACLRSSTMSPQRSTFIDYSEIAVTIALDLEIVLRFTADFRGFFKSKHNIVDLFLAIMTSVIQIPAIKTHHQAYAWLTIFQVARIYRVVLAVRVTRELIVLVLGNFWGLANLILFLFLLTFLAALFAVQLFRGEIPGEDAFGNTNEVTFDNIWNAFLGMYQILSSENWTTILYNVTANEHRWRTAWIGAAFCILWYILANFIVLNMFIAVIQENFDVSEDEKRVQQVKAYLQHQQYAKGGGPLSLSAIFQFGKVRRQDPLDYGAASAGMLVQPGVVNDFLDDTPGHLSPRRHADSPDANLPRASTHMMLSPAPGNIDVGQAAHWWKKLRNFVWDPEPNPFYGRLKLSGASHDLDPRRMAEEVVKARERRKLEQRQYLQKHPMYNVTLFVFKEDNPLRVMCQRMIGPGRGIEIDRLQPSRPVYYSFAAFIYAAIVAMVLLACVTTPLYQKEYFAKHGYSRQNWFIFTDIGFAGLFTVEAIIRVIADGFFWTPNAYLRNSWGFIDFVVLVTLWADIITILYDPGGGSRAVGAFKALRALRLLNVSDSTRDTFHSVIVLGGWKVVSAAFVNVSLLIPFAIYGLNLFSGKMQECNDGSEVYNLTDCVNEYMSSPFAWNVLAPRRVSNSYYSFDNFGSSIFILFQIVSLEGWIDVMWSASSITGTFTQPSTYASEGNAAFFVAFNLLGAVFVLTLFVSVFMRNYTEQTGVAFLTTEQRSWLELRKLLRQVSPSKRPSPKERRDNWREWCYKRAVQKNGWWQRGITILLTVHLVLLCLEWYPDSSYWLRVRDYMFLLLTICYIINIVVRIVGLSWSRFRHSAWDIYSLLAVAGTLGTTIALLTNFESDEHIKAHKLFLVSVALLLIPRNNQLDQLFKTAAASLTAIVNLLATWFVLFLVFAIALTQTFGLTRFHSTNENGNINFRTVPKALILLFRFSVGEGWNQYMWDFQSVQPPVCTVGERYFDGDCGSDAWAKVLFVAWNILSMYIFINLFVSLIYESFSYVYQRSSGLSAISREEIRRFKQAWAEYDPSGSGYISREAFPRLLGELSGVFEMRIYDGDFTVRNIIDDCRLKRAQALPFDGAGDSDLDLHKLNQRLAELPIAEIQRRRRRMNTFYEEVLVSADPDRGIEFGALLMILAHYKVINDNKSLRLEEYLRRRARMNRVDEAVKRNIVLGFFDTMFQVRKFRQHLEAKRKRTREELGLGPLVPEILVHDESDAHDLSKPPTAPYDPLTPTETGHVSLGDTLTSTPGSSGSTPSLSNASRPSGFGALIQGANAASPGGVSNTPPPTMSSRYRSDSIQVSPRINPARGGAVRGQSSLAGGPPSSNSPGQNLQLSTHDIIALDHSGRPRGSSDLRPWGMLDPLDHVSPRASSDQQRVRNTGAADANRPRATSNALSVNDFIESEALSNSAWGESIRRASTLRRTSSSAGRTRGSSFEASSSTIPGPGRSSTVARRTSGANRKVT